jgi:hypothetical protein
MLLPATLNRMLFTLSHCVREDCRHKDAKGEISDFGQNRQYWAGSQGVQTVWQGILAQKCQDQQENRKSASEAERPRSRVGRGLPCTPLALGLAMLC